MGRLSGKGRGRSKGRGTILAMEEKTAKSIMDNMTAWIKEGKLITPEKYIETAENLNLLESYEHDLLIDLERQYNDLLNLAAETQGVEKPNMTAAEKKAKSSDIYVAYRKQELFVKRIDQAIALAKKHATLTSYAH